MEPNEQNKQMSKIEPEAGNQGTDCQRPEGRKEGDKVGKKGNGLVKEHVRMTHGHRKHGGD